MLLLLTDIKPHSGCPDETKDGYVNSYENRVLYLVRYSCTLYLSFASDV